MYAHTLLALCPASGTPHPVCGRGKSSNPIGLLFVGFGAAVKDHGSQMNTSFSCRHVIHTEHVEWKTLTILVLEQDCITLRSHLCHYYDYLKKEYPQKKRGIFIISITVVTPGRHSPRIHPITRDLALASVASLPLSAVTSPPPFPGLSLRPPSSSVFVVE